MDVDEVRDFRGLAAPKTKGTSALPVCLSTVEMGLGLAEEAQGGGAAKLGRARQINPLGRKKKKKPCSIGKGGNKSREGPASGGRCLSGN